MLHFAHLLFTNSKVISSFFYMFQLADYLWHGIRTGRVSVHLCVITEENVQRYHLSLFALGLVYLDPKRL